MLAGEGEPDEVVEKRGLKVVSDDSALTAAVDEALAAQPDVAEKIRGGKVAGGGRDRRRGHEGDQGPGRRQAGPRADHGTRRLLTVFMKQPFSVKSVTWREWLGLAAGLLALGRRSCRGPR